MNDSVGIMSLVFITHYCVSPNKNHHLIWIFPKWFRINEVNRPKIFGFSLASNHFWQQQRPGKKWIVGMQETQRAHNVCVCVVWHRQHSAQLTHENCSNRKDRIYTFLCIRIDVVDALCRLVGISHYAHRWCVHIGVANANRPPIQFTLPSAFRHSSVVHVCTFSSPDNTWNNKMLTRLGDRQNEDGVFIIYSPATIHRSRCHRTSRVSLSFFPQKHTHFRFISRQQKVKCGKGRKFYLF